MKTTVLEGLNRAARAGRMLTFLDEAQRPQPVPFTDLVAGSDERARALIGRHGVAPGDRICFLGETTPALLCALLATWRAGAITVVLPLQRRAIPTDALLAEVERRMSAAHSTLLIAAAPFDQALADQPVRQPVPHRYDPAGPACLRVPQPGQHLQRRLAGRVAAAPDPAAMAVQPGRQLQPHIPAPMPAARQARAPASVLPPGYRIGAPAPPEHRPLTSHDDHLHNGE